MHIIAKLKDNEYPYNGINHTRRVARAVVLNENNEVALIKLHGKDWFGDRNYYETPGGGAKKYERITSAVIREIKEELGVECHIVAELGIVEDYYNLINRKNINYYFLLKTERKCHIKREPFERKFFEKVVWANIELAISLMESNPNKEVGLLVKNRELPILKLAQKKINELYN